MGGASPSGGKKILVLGEDTRIILPIIRSLGRRGFRVHVGWCPPGAPALRSRYVRSVHRLPFPSPSQAAWQHGLLSVLDRERFDLVLPATEAAVFPLQRHRQDFEGRGRLYLLGERAFAVAFDKAKTWELARSLGLRVPRSVIVSAATGADDLLTSFRFPVVVKPLCSVHEGNPLRKNFVRVVAHPGEFQAVVAGMPRPFQIQEFFEGEGVGVEFLAERGEVLFAFQHVRLHETRGYGSTYRASSPLDPQLLAAAKKFLQALDYTGVGMLEFRVNRATGDWVLLELNGRFWGSLPLAVAAGADFPFYLYQFLVEGRRRFPAHYRVGVRCSSLFNDTRWLWRSFRGKHRPAGEADDPGWEINVVRWPQLLGDALRLATFRDHLDTFSPDDPLPVLTEVRSLWELVVRWALRERWFPVQARLPPTSGARPGAT